MHSTYQSAIRVIVLLCTCVEMIIVWVKGFSQVPLVKMSAFFLLFVISKAAVTMQCNSCQRVVVARKPGLSCNAIVDIPLRRTSEDVRWIICWLRSCLQAASLSGLGSPEKLLSVVGMNSLVLCVKYLPPKSRPDCMYQLLKIDLQGFDIPPITPSPSFERS